MNIYRLIWCLSACVAPPFVLKTTDRDHLDVNGAALVVSISQSGLFFGKVAVVLRTRLSCCCGIGCSPFFCSLFFSCHNRFLHLALYYSKKSNKKYFIWWRGLFYLSVYRLYKKQGTKGGRGTEGKRKAVVNRGMCCAAAWMMASEAQLAVGV